MGASPCCPPAQSQAQFCGVECPPRAGWVPRLCPASPVTHPPSVFQPVTCPYFSLPHPLTPSQASVLPLASIPQLLPPARMPSLHPTCSHLIRNSYPLSDIYTANTLHRFITYAILFIPYNDPLSRCIPILQERKQTRSG